MANEWIASVVSYVNTASVNVHYHTPNFIGEEDANFVRKTASNADRC